VENLIKAIANGEKNNKFFYVCDIRYKDKPFGKLLRNVKPIKVMVRSNDALPSNKRIYYSESHFVKLKKNGEPSTQVLPLYDNTGYRMVPGTPLQVFNTLAEATEKYREQKEVIVIAMHKFLENYQDQLDDFVREGY